MALPGAGRSGGAPGGVGIGWRRWGPERVEALKLREALTRAFKCSQTNAQDFCWCSGSKSSELMGLEVKIERLPGLDEDEKPTYSVATRKDWEVRVVQTFGESLGVYSV